MNEEELKRRIQEVIESVEDVLLRGRLRSNDRIKRVAVRRILDILDEEIKERLLDVEK